MTYVLVAVGVPFLLSLGITPLVIRWAQGRGLVDHPGGRRHHRMPVPRAGGVAPVIAFLVTVTLPWLWPSLFPPIADPNQPLWWKGLVLGALVALVGGLWDDRVDLSPAAQFVIQLLCAIIAIWATLFIERVNNPFTDRQVIFPRLIVWWLTVFWVLGMMNTVNWLDGVDGLVTSVTAVFATVLAVHLVQRGLHSVAVWPLALLGASLGFLPYNWPPARIFLGSAGAYGLGYIIAVLGIAAGAKVATVLLVLGLPIADVAWQIARRWREGRSVFTADRGHLHLRLLDRGWTPVQVIGLYVAWSVVTGILALLVSSRLLKLGLLGIVAVATVALFLWATRPRAG